MALYHSQARRHVIKRVKKYFEFNVLGNQDMIENIYLLIRLSIVLFLAKPLVLVALHV